VVELSAIDEGNATADVAFDFFLSAKLQVL
jgi:hypothetical protein